MTDLTDLPADEFKMLMRLRRNIDKKRTRNRLRTRLYDAHKNVEHFGISVPPNMRDFATVIGWPAKAVDTPARRIRPDGFSSSKSSGLFDEVQEALAQPRAMAVEKLAIQASLRHSCAFVFASAGDEELGEPQLLLTAASALDASAVVDERTGATRAALETVDGGWWLYLPGKAIRVVRKHGRYKVEHEINRGHQRVPCTVYAWGRTIDRQFGRSRITRPLIGLTEIGVRILLRQEVSAEFYSFPQRWMLGAREEDFQDESGRVLSAWESIIGGLLTMPDIPIEEEQDSRLRRVELGQFPQMSMQPHSDHMKTIAMMVSGETSLPLNYLGIIQDNPPSAESILATEADLTQIVEDELDWYRDSRTNLARDAAAVMHGEWTPEMVADLRGIRSEFRPPSTPTKSAEADWAIKVVTAFPWLAESETMLRMIFSQQVAKQLVAERRRNEGPGVLAQVLEQRALAASLPASQSVPESEAIGLEEK